MKRSDYQCERQNEWSNKWSPHMKYGSRLQVIYVLVETLLPTEHFDSLYIFGDKDAA